MIFTILLAIAATAAALVLAIRVRNQAGALRATTQRIDTLQADLDTARLDCAHHVVRADTAESECDEARSKASSLATDLELTTTSLTAALRSRNDATAEIEQLREAQHLGADTAALWALELARVERRWHASVAPGIDLTSPLVDASVDDQPRVALEIVAAALREETGTRSSVDWQLAAPLAAATALLTVRAGDEMMASAAPQAEAVRLTVSMSDGRVILRVDAFDTDNKQVAHIPFATLPTPSAAGTLTVEANAVFIEMPTGAHLMA